MKGSRFNGSLLTPDPTPAFSLTDNLGASAFPVILFDSQFWGGFLDWLRRVVLAEGYISIEDIELVRICDDPSEVVNIVQSWYLHQAIIGKKVF